MKDRIELEGGVSKDCMDNADTGVLLTKAGLASMTTTIILHVSIL